MTEIRMTGNGLRNSRMEGILIPDQGEVVDLPRAAAVALVAGKFAEYVDEADADAPAVDEPTAKDIRDWAKDNGVDCPARGAIPDAVREAYAAATAPVTE